MTIVAASRVSPIGMSVFGHHRTRSGNAKRYENTQDVSLFYYLSELMKRTNRIESGTSEQLSPFFQRLWADACWSFCRSSQAQAAWHSFGDTPQVGRAGVGESTRWSVRSKIHTKTPKISTFMTIANELRIVTITCLSPRHAVLDRGRPANHTLIRFVVQA